MHSLLVQFAYSRLGQHESSYLKNVKAVQESQIHGCFKGNIVPFAGLNALKSELILSFQDRMIISNFSGSE